MRQAATQELYSYWNQLRGARLSPEREEIDPSAIRHILADTMILEVDEERQFPVRISGTRLNALFQSEQKGSSFVGLFAPEERQAASAMILSVLDGVRPIVAGLTAAPEEGEAATLELLLLPLRHHGKNSRAHPRRPDPNRHSVLAWPAPGDLPAHDFDALHRERPSRPDPSHAARLGVHAKVAGRTGPPDENPPPRLLRHSRRALILKEFRVEFEELEPQDCPAGASI